MKSAGQASAISQLEDIVEGSGGVFDIVEAAEPAEEGGAARVTVSIHCGGFPHKEGGVRLPLRERIRLAIPWRFPLERPSANFTHDRYGGTPHVQWGNHICLYLAPDIEWQPGQGMVGFMDRLQGWLNAAAAAELDPIGMPLHPPVAYQVASFSVVPHVNAPRPEATYWAGYALITDQNSNVAELGEWVKFGEPAPAGGVVTAILLPGAMPFEYPKSMLDLMTAIIARGVWLETLRAIIELGLLRAGAGKPALFLLGAAMRGIVGGDRLQYLACWRIPADQADKLRSALQAAAAGNPVGDEAFYNWARTANVEWCRVLEDRPEIVERRDTLSRASFWRGKRVGLLGCGAIGSNLALMLARAGAAHLDLYDNGIIAPGILVRQNFWRSWIGYSKCSAVKGEVEQAIPGAKATEHSGDILKVIADPARMAVLLDLDVIIDATASSIISIALESHFREHPKKHPPIVTMALGHNADFAMMTLATADGTGMTFDLDRRSKIALSNTGKGSAFLEEFWPIAPERRKLFQPEPGCSSPTFRGSATDVMGLTARMANIAAGWLSEEASPRAFAMNLSGEGIVNGPAREIEIPFASDKLLKDPRHAFEVRLSRDAEAALLSWVRRSERTRGDRTETGGLLFGEVDEFLKIVWINEVGGPPSDSLASPEGFVCGTSGVAEMNAEKIKRSRGSVSFCGMWHTHPQGRPAPSPIDRRAMRLLLEPGSDFVGRRFLMMIIGGTAKKPAISVNMFDRSDYG